MARQVVGLRDRVAAIIWTLDFFGRGLAVMIGLGCRRNLREAVCYRTVASPAAGSYGTGRIEKESGEDGVDLH